MDSHSRRWLAAPLIATTISVVSVLSACTSTDVAQPKNVPTEIYQQFEALGYRCVARDTGAADKLGNKCAAVDEQSLRVVSFVTSGDDVVSWSMSLDPQEGVSVDAELVDGAVRPAFEMLAGNDVEQAVSYAVAFATGPGGGTSSGGDLSTVEDAVGVSGSEFQLTASNSEMLGLNFNGVLLGEDAMGMSPVMLTVMTFAEVDLDAATTALTDAGFTCDDNDLAAMMLQCDGLPSISVMAINGRATSINCLVYDDQPDQVAALDNIATALNEAITTDGDFADVFGETAEGTSRYVRVVGDFLFVVRGENDANGHATNYDTL